MIGAGRLPHVYIDKNKSEWYFIENVFVTCKIKGVFV
jgi:hypothetical protein